MMDAISWIEQTRLSAFVREDLAAYFVLLIFHAWGMALLVGGGAVVSLRVIGIAGGARLEGFRKVIAWMKAGAVMAAISGLGLLAGYPAKALTNWVFALKFVFLVCAALLVRNLARDTLAAPRAPDGYARMQAALSLALWLLAIAAGKLLLYTNTMLLTSDAA